MSEVVLEKQEDIEDEVCRFYEGLYANGEVEHSKDGIMECIGEYGSPSDGPVLVKPG